MSKQATEFELCRPPPQMLPELYRLLGEVFEPDRPLMGCVLEGTVRLSNWDHFVLCRQSEIVSHAALVHLRVWCAGRIVPLAGVASVFTRPEYRGSGLARRVIEAALALADQAREACVLFTSLPELYERFGFRSIDQGYLAADAMSGGICSDEYEFVEVTKLGPRELEEIDRIYSRESAPYDGKMEREADYWAFYQAVFNGRTDASVPSGRPDVCLYFCRRNGRTHGYVRMERERESMLISELYACGDGADVTETMLAHVFEQARRERTHHVSLALPERHVAWRILRERGIGTVPDVSTQRESFMVRANGRNDGLLKLRWSLADKF